MSHDHCRCRYLVLGLGGRGVRAWAAPVSDGFLFIGGPYDGQVRALQKPLEGVWVAEVDEWVFDPTNEADTLMAPTYKTTYYRPVKLVLFGTKAKRPVLIHQYIDEAHQGRAVAQALLNDFGKALL